MFPGQPWYHPTAQLHHGFLRKTVGDCVTPYVLESCLIIHVLLNLQVHRHVPCRFWKDCLGLNIFHRSIMGKLTCFGCSPHIGYHWFGVLLKWACSFCVSGSQHQCSVIWMLLWEVFGGRTVPDGGGGILQAIMMVVAGCHYVDFCWANAHLLSSFGSR